MQTHTQWKYIVFMNATVVSHSYHFKMLGITSCHHVFIMLPWFYKTAYLQLVNCIIILIAAALTWQLCSHFLSQFDFSFAECELIQRLRGMTLQYSMIVVIYLLQEKVLFFSLQV